jgi:hypothetical protein
MQAIQVVQKQTQAAQVKWWAFKDAEQRSKRNKTLWDRAVQLKVERMIVAMGEVYKGSIYEDFGKTTCGVKISRAIVRDKQLLKQYEADLAAEGIVKHVTSTGVAYKVA